MRKVTKIFVKILSTIILLLIMLPVVATLVLSVPSVENFVLHRATDVVSKTLGTKVSADHITIGMLNRVKVRGFYVEDYDCDTLLYAGSVTAYLGPLTGITKNLSIVSVDVEDAVFNLRETERGGMNIKEVVDRLSNPDKPKKGGFTLGISSLYVNGLDFRLSRLNSKEVEYGVDYSDMYLQGVTTQIDDFKFEGGAVSGDISMLSFVEQSGLKIDDMSGKFLVDRGVISLKDASIVTDDTSLNMPQFSIAGKGWDSYKDFIRRVVIDVEVENSSTTSATVGYFAPSLLRWQTSVNDVNLTMHGTVADFKASVGSMTFEDGGVLSASAQIKGLTDVKHTKFDVDINSLDVSTVEFTRLLKNIATLEVPQKIQPYIERTENLNVTGTFRGFISSFDAQAVVALGSGGTVSAQCSIHPEDGERRITAVVDADSLAVSRVAALSEPVNATFKISADALVGDSVVDASAVGSVSSLLAGGYTYNNMLFDLNYADDNAMVTFVSKDSAVKAQLKALVNIADISSPVYNAVAEIERLDLKAIGINKRDSISCIKAAVSVLAKGKSLDDMDGEISIADAVYDYNDKQINSDIIRLLVDRNDNVRTMKLNSDFADMVFESQSSYKNVIGYAANFIAHYLPQLYDSTTLHRIESQEAEEHNSVAMLSLTTKNLSPLLDCIATGVEVAPESIVSVLMDPSSNRFIMRGRSECVERYPYLASEIVLDANNKGDSLVVNLKTDELWAGALRLSDFDLHGGAKSNTLDIKSSFVDSLHNASGDIAARAHVFRKDSIRHISVDILPSRVGSAGKEWTVTSNGVDISSDKIDIRSFELANKSDRQSLTVNGIASRNVKDSLRLNLNNFSLAPFTRFTEQIGYGIEGRTTGYVTVKSALKDTQIDASVGLDSILVNGIPFADMNLTSRWDFGRSRAKLSLTTVAENKEVVRGYFSPSQTKYYATISVPKLNMGLLDPLLSGVISDTGGSADIKMVLEGERGSASLNGEITVSDLSTTLDYTRCTYTAPSAKIAVKNNQFTLKGAPIFDKDKNRGTLSMDLSLNHLSNIAYDLSANFNQMQVLNTTIRDNEMFYGDVFATGNITVKGNKSGVTMDIAASTAGDTKFYMPLTNNSNIASADFVSFVQPETRDTTAYLAKKKMKFENRSKKRTSSNSSMNINMSIDVFENAEAQLVIDPTVGDIIKGRGNGMLNLRINPSADLFEMNGLYTITEGSYLFTMQNVFNKKFIIDRDSGSTIQWSGDPLDAILNIAAVYKTKTSLQPLLEGYVDTSVSSRAVPVNCIINLTDRLTKPTVDFNVEVPSADASMQAVIANVLSTPERRSQQFLYLLIAGSFLSENSADAASFGVSSAAMTGFELLSNQLSNWLSSESSNIILRYRPKTEQMMSDEVDFGVSQGFMGNRLLVELEGNYLVDKSQVANASSSFTGEAYVTWLIDQAGTMRIRGFTHTIDRFDENQGLQETGVGLYFKEDFENGRDLRTRLANRFRRKNKKIRADNDDSSRDDDAYRTMQVGVDAIPGEDFMDNYD